MVLVVVAMGALRAVEEVERLFLVWGCGGGELRAVGVGGGIPDSGGFAVETAAGAVPEAEEEGRGCC